MAIGRFMRKKNLGKRKKREKKLENGILFTKIVLTYCEKNCFSASSDTDSVASRARNELAISKCD